MEPRRRLLVAYSNASTFTATTFEYLDSFRQYSSWEVHYVHVTHSAEPRIRLEDYDAVLLSYCARLCFPGYVSVAFIEKLRAFGGVRGVCIQDEYDFVENERIALDSIRPDVVFTCIPADQRELVYPSRRYPNTEFVQVLTGYVPVSVASRARATPVRERPIHIGYRARDLGPRYGAFARMKYGIGAAFRDAASARGVPVDIAMDEKSRIYGSAWYEWLSKCRCVLGTESGSNVFDFDGSIAKACLEHDGRPLPASIRARIDELDRTFSMGQISARVFEAAVTFTPLALYEGRYSDVIRPHEHYIPVAPDHSNMDEVFRAIEDTDSLQQMAERAHARLIGSELFSYSAFVAQVESALERRTSRPPVGGVVTAGPPTTDPSRSALDERATSAPRPFDSFLLLQLRARLERPTTVARASLVALLPASVRDRLRRLRNGARAAWHRLPRPLRSSLARPVGAVRECALLSWIR